MHKCCQILSVYFQEQLCIISTSNPASNYISHISEQRGNSLLYSMAFFSHSQGFSFSHSNSLRQDLNVYTDVLIVELKPNSLIKPVSIPCQIHKSIALVVPDC